MTNPTDNVATTPDLGKIETLLLQIPEPAPAVNGVYNLRSFSWVRLRWAEYLMDMTAAASTAMLSFAPPGNEQQVIIHSSLLLPTPASTSVHFHVWGIAAFVVPGVSAVMLPMPSVWVRNPTTLTWGTSTPVPGNDVNAITMLIDVIPA
jgi:hypothetical protein